MTIAVIIKGRIGEVWSCAGHETVRDAVAMLADKRIGALPVIEDGAVVGIFSERDVVYGLERMGPAFLDCTVAEVMTSPALTVDPATPVLSALSLMTKRRIRHLPVVRGDKIVGFVSIGDLVKYRIDKIEHEAEAMRAYIQSV